VLLVNAVVMQLADAWDVPEAVHDANLCESNQLQQRIHSKWKAIPLLFIIIIVVIIIITIVIIIKAHTAGVAEPTMRERPGQEHVTQAC